MSILSIVGSKIMRNRAFEAVAQWNVLREAADSMVPLRFQELRYICMRAGTFPRASGSIEYTQQLHVIKGYDGTRTVGGCNWRK